MAVQVGTSQIKNGAVTAAKLAGDALNAPLQNRKIGRWVQTGDQGNPNADFVDVTNLLQFNATAGVNPEAQVKGKGALLEAVGGAEFNTTSGKVGGAAKASSSKCQITDQNGDSIVNQNGQAIWGVITTPARDNVGPYKLRFFVGEFGSGTEVPFVLTQGFVFWFGQVFDLLDMPQWDSAVLQLVDKDAAMLAPGQIVTALLANDSVTDAKLAPVVRQRVSLIAMDDDIPVPTATQATGYVSLPPGGGSNLLVTASGTPDANVHVAVPGLVVNHLGAVSNVASADPFGPIPARVTPGNTRKDIIVVDAAGVIVRRQGAEGGAPADPALMTGDVPLARILIDDEAPLTIEAGDIVDLRSSAGLSGRKLKGRSVSWDALALVPKFDSFIAPGNDAKFVLTSRFSPTKLAMYAPAFQVWRNGLRMKFVVAGAAGMDEYQVIDETNQTKIQFGANIDANDDIFVAYMHEQ